jgi:DNA ligase-associated metallophosphoesterase
MTTVSTEIAGETLVLLPERAVFWERTATLLVADAHIGKAAAFRAAGVPMPRGTTGGTLSRLAAAIARTRAARVVLLGDFLHAREGRSPETLQSLHTWRESHSGIEMILVRGNHDQRAGNPPPEARIRCVDGMLADPPFVFTHWPDPAASGYVIAGHIHPGVRLTGMGRDHVRLPCFWFGARVAVLPAFGELTGLADVAPEPGDRLWVIVEDG